jgi:hypothetical protein
MVIPFGNSLGQMLMRPLRREWARNTSLAIKAAERSSGLSREDLAEWVDTDPRAVPLYMKVLWAAGMNGHDATLRAMGAVLGQAAMASKAQDDESFEDAELALHAMADLGPRHFTVLSALGEGVVVLTEDGQEVFLQFVPTYIAEKTGLRQSVVAQCLVNLAGAGLADTLSVLEHMAYPITDLGRAVLEASQILVDGGGK